MIKKKELESIVSEISIEEREQEGIEKRSHSYQRSLVVLSFLIVGLYETLISIKKLLPRE